ncbi:MAG: hypothetical protein BWY96_00794 [Spirochaetes bacterium ADurb.BinA120]|nr:MAG: hypothetical protein BWY96_00794 [Spirochaetes bacterium ADurb.BinA120]
MGRTMKQPFIHTALHVALVCVVVASCSDDGRKALERALSRYEKSTPASTIADIGGAVIAMALVESFDEPYPIESGNSLVFRSGKKLSVVFPFRRTIEAGEDAVLLSAESTKRTLTVAGAEGLMIYSGRAAAVTVPNPEGPVRAACRLDDDTVLFLAGRSLYRYSPSSGGTTPFLKGENFSPPFRGDFYRAELKRMQGRAIVIAGIAGRYNMSIVSTAPPSIILANRAIASPRIAITDRGFRCVTGAPGLRTVTEFSPDGRVLGEIARPGRISDIALFSAGMFYEDNEAIQALPDGSSSARALPFGWRLAGQADNILMIEHAGKLHALDPDRLFAALELIERLAPEVLKR